MEGWFQPTKPQQEAHVVAVFTGTSSFVAAICTLQGYSEHTHILASRQKFPVPGSMCVERQYICHASSWLKQVMVAFALLTMPWRAAGRGEGKARTMENLFTLMDAIGELHLLRVGKASSSRCLLSVAECPLELLFLVCWHQGGSWCSPALALTITYYKSFPASSKCNLPSQVVF